MPAKGSTDIRFESKRAKVTVSIYSYADDGDLVDHRNVITDYYGTRDYDVELEDDDVKMFGTDGFRGVLKKEGAVTMVVGIVLKGRFYRIHTSGKKAKPEDLKRIHAAFVKLTRFGR